MKVKICGITTLDDALAAMEAGADLIGFNFYPISPRYIDPHDCAHIRSALQDRGPAVTSVGVFVNASPLLILSILESCGLDYAQLSGDEPPEYLEELGEKSLKAIRPASPADLAQITSLYPPRKTAPAWLMDAQEPGKYGGTGKRADWSLARQLARQHPLLLAGGLDPSNVARAVQMVHPWGVDVASGVEISPGRKDPKKMIDFVRAARVVEEEVEYAD